MSQSYHKLAKRSGSWQEPCTEHYRNFNLMLSQSRSTLNVQLSSLRGMSVCCWVMTSIYELQIWRYIQQCSPRWNPLWNVQHKYTEALTCQSWPNIHKGSWTSPGNGSRQEQLRRLWKVPKLLLRNSPFLQTERTVQLRKAHATSVDEEPWCSKLSFRQCYRSQKGTHHARLS